MKKVSGTVLSNLSNRSPNGMRPEGANRCFGWSRIFAIYITSPYLAISCLDLQISLGTGLILLNGGREEMQSW